MAAHIRAGLSLAGATALVLADVTALGGDGGLIAIDATGDVALPFTSRGMYRGTVGADGLCRTGIYAGLV